MEEPFSKPKSTPKARDNKNPAIQPEDIVAKTKVGNGKKVLAANETGEPSDTPKQELMAPDPGLAEEALQPIEDLSITGVDPAARFVETPFVRKKRFTENVARMIFLGMSLCMILPLLLIVGYLFYKAAPILSWDFIFSNPQNGMRAGGIWAALLGTIYLVGISLLVSAPIGVFAAVYLNEYARENWFTRIINLAVVNLAGVPSIVHALFGLGAFVLFAGIGRSILAASLTLAIMTLPVIIASTKEALAAVPIAFREACWNVGATRWQTIRRIVLPNSISGILTGIILQVSRAAGETAPIMFTGAVFYKAIEEGDLFAYGLLEQCMALSMHLFTISTQVPNVPEALPFGTAVVLLGTVLLVNAFAIGLRVYLRSRKKW
jgi:phosphate transport system permease protein